jgi:hypothetical protein
MHHGASLLAMDTLTDTTAVDTLAGPMLVDVRLGEFGWIDIN